MGRPPKDANIPSARERLIEAFGKLLQKNKIEEIGIKTIIARANCNRATFYYYFSNIYDLFDAYIESRLLSDGLISGVLFNITTGDGSVEAGIKRLTSERAIELVNAMNNGGSNPVKKQVAAKLISLWEEGLGIAKGTLKPRCRSIVYYQVSGFLGMLKMIDVDNKKHFEEEFPRMFIREGAPIILSCICKEQGVSEKKLKHSSAN